MEPREEHGDPVDRRSAALSTVDRRILARVERYLARGLALKRWWERQHGSRQRDVRGRFEERFELAFTFNRPDTSFGFFDTARVEGRPFPVLGNLQGMFYDQSKSGVRQRSGAARQIDRQLREFVLRYFMRVADFRDPQPYTEGQPQPPLLLSPLSMCFRDDAPRLGFGYRQLYYKRRDDGRVGRFPRARERRIIDLREIGRRYEWIVVKVNIFDFRFNLQPYGHGSPSLDLPLAESSLLVLSPHFITDQRARGGGGDGGERGELGRYGLGYAFIRNPEQSLVGWGPGKFEAAFQTIDFRVLDDGRIRAVMVFVADRPSKVGNIPVNPFLAGLEGLDLFFSGRLSKWTGPMRRIAGMIPGSGLRIDPVLPTIALANLATGGMARRAFCISRQQLERRLILVHFLQHYNAILGSLQTWRQIDDWLDQASLPRWVVTGDSA